MHEFSIATELVATVLAETAKHNLARVAKIKVAIAPLAVLNKEVFEDAFSQLASGAGLGTVAVEFLDLPLRIRCAYCGRETEVSPPAEGFQELWHNPKGAALPERCPNCGSSALEFPGASELLLWEIEGEIKANSSLH